MRTKILITGGTGMVGMQLSQMLKQQNFEVFHLSRKENLDAEFPAYRWNIKEGFIDNRALEVDHIIHLAGAGVADSRWTDSRKKQIYDSRIDSTRLLVDKVHQVKSPLQSFICASAIGWYGVDTGDRLMKEEDPPAKDFLAEVVNHWEQEAFKLSGIPVATVRIGIVLSREGGALAKMAMPVKFGVGAPLGSGNQYISWIHVDDLAEMIIYLVKNKAQGSFNAVAPNPATNKEFTKLIGKVLKRPVFLPNVPSFALKLALGEMSQAVLGGNKVSNERITNHGFEFKYKELMPALQNLLT
jgi:uncharacterized protein (TIGR01777 family)